MSKRKDKSEFLKRYRDSFGKIGECCLAMQMNRATYYKWLENDPEFKATIETVDHSFVDFVESKILEKIKTGSDYWLKQWLVVGPGRSDRWKQPEVAPTQLAGSLNLTIERKTIS